MKKNVFFSDKKQIPPFLTPMAVFSLIVAISAANLATNVATGTHEGKKVSSSSQPVVTTSSSMPSRSSMSSHSSTASSESSQSSSSEAKDESSRSSSERDDSSSSSSFSLNIDDFKSSSKVGGN
ncbi:hypothetical protein [Eupransor demetentiae]|uniref:hypothetical protein n=1 Tax=Eupransor demetentiae TaxID=3109584 RepID=UPI0032E35EF2